MMIFIFASNLSNSFHITKDGIRSKIFASDTEWSSWRSEKNDHSKKEPLKVLKQCPPAQRELYLLDVKLLTKEERDACRYWVDHVIPEDSSTFFSELARGNTGVVPVPAAAISGPLPDVVRKATEPYLDNPVIKLVFGRFRELSNDLYVEKFNGEQQPITKERALKDFSQLYEDLRKSNRKFRQSLEAESAPKRAKNEPSRKQRKNC